MSSLALISLAHPASADTPRPRAPASQQAALGQFMTPEPIAEFMAAQFDQAEGPVVRLLDAGAGRGALSTAFVRRWSSYASPQARLSIDAFELDSVMVDALGEIASQWERDTRIDATVLRGDFITIATERLRRRDATYTHAILNPPYKKIGSQSARLV